MTQNTQDTIQVQFPDGAETVNRATAAGEIITLARARGWRRIRVSYHGRGVSPDRIPADAVTLTVAPYDAPGR